MISGGDLIEPVAAIRDQPRENIESPRRALRIGGAEDSVSKRQAFQKRHDIEATAFQHGAVAFERHLIIFERGEEFVDAAPLSRQETGAHAIGLGAEPQIETGGLNLPMRQGRGEADLTGVGHRLNLPAGKHAAASRDLR